jgi:HlyD family secretion protein
MKNSRIWWIIGGFLGLIILLLVLKKTGVVGGGDEILVEIDTVKTRTIIETVSASGKLQPVNEVKISADVSGEIITLNVEEGQKVNAGDLLVRVNPDIYQSSRQRAEAGVNNAKANLMSAKANYAQRLAIFENKKLEFNRNKSLFDQKVIALAEYETSVVDFKVNEAQLEAALQSVKAAEYTVLTAEATLKETTDNLRRTTVMAPISGTITNLNVETGERVVGTTQMQGTEMMRISNLDEMMVKVDVNENDIIRIKKGDTAIVDVDAFPNQKFKGLVVEIANSARTEGVSLDQVTNFSVRLQILKESYKHLIDESRSIATPFRPGMSAIVEIQTTRRENTLSIPVLAVTTRKEANSDHIEIIYLYNKGKVREQAIKTGIQDDFFIEVIDSLKEGDIIVSGPYSVVSKSLKDGKEVRIKQ